MSHLAGGHGRQPTHDAVRGKGCDESLDPRSAKVLTAGVDVGSVSAQAVVCADGAPWAWASMRAGPARLDSGREVMERALDGSGIELGELHFVVATGYGRVKLSFAHKRISEIHCHARGARFLYGPELRTVLDVGGQDYKAIRCDARGKVQSFLVSDKCAAGTGRGLEVFADLLEVPLDELGPMSLAVEEEPEPVSDVCVVFARSEAASRLRAGWSREAVMAAYCRATAERVLALLEQLGVEPGFGVTGGIAKNAGVVTRLERALGLEVMKSDFDPQLAGALGAALLGTDLSFQVFRRESHAEEEEGRHARQGQT